MNVWGYGWVQHDLVCVWVCVCMHGLECLQITSHHKCSHSSSLPPSFTVFLPSAAPVNKTTWWTLPDRPGCVTITAARGGHCGSVPEVHHTELALWPDTSTPTRTSLFLLTWFWRVQSTSGDSSDTPSPTSPYPSPETWNNQSVYSSHSKRVHSHGSASMKLCRKE